MILTTKQVQDTFNTDYYDGCQIHSRFAYRVFRKKVLPIGNIIAFRSKMIVENNLIDQEDILNKDFIYSDDAINFCWEIPLIGDIFGATAYQRLFNTQVANILSSQFLRKPIEVDGDDLMVHDQFENHGIVQSKGKCSVSITHVLGQCALGHTGINIDAGRRAPAFAYSTKLSDEKATAFMGSVIEMFYSMNDDIFTAGTKV